MKVPDYLKRNNGEFVIHDGEIVKIKIEFIGFDQWPAIDKLRIAEMLEADSKAQSGLDILEIYEDMARIKQYAWCKFGGFDHEADLKVCGQHQIEYFDCPRRNSCPVAAQKLLCGVLHVKNDVYLTPREIEVIKATCEGKLDKQIADKLNISINTVNSHRRNIQQKNDTRSKSEMVRFAAEKGII